MKPSELHAETDKHKSKIMAALSLGYVAEHRSVNGIAGSPVASRPNREALRRQKYGHTESSAFGQIYADTVDPKEIAKRRAKNKRARKSRAQNR